MNTATAGLDGDLAEEEAEMVREALTDIHAGIPKAERFDRFLRRLPQNLRFIKDIVEAERKPREKS